MHTLMLVAGGLVALAVFALVSILLGRGSAAGARWFILPWLVAALYNLYLGTLRGYSVVQEIPFFLIVFGVPALAAFAVMRWDRWRRTTPA
jgi:hypothetical protein